MLYGILLIGMGCTVAFVCAGILTHAGRRLSEIYGHTPQQWDADRRLSRLRTLPLWWRMLWPLAVRLAALVRWARPAASAMPRSDLFDQADLPVGITPLHLRCVRMATALCAMLTALAAMTAINPVHWQSVSVAHGVVAMLVLTGYVWPGFWVRARIRTRRRAIERDLPFVLELLALCVQGGLSIQGALHEAVRHGPPGVLRDELARFLSDLRSGHTRAAAFDALSRRGASRALSASIRAIVQAEALGISLGRQLKALARAQTVARFERAERQALKAPVKLLLPLMLFIFPCTFIALGFPIAMSIRTSVL